MAMQADKVCLVLPISYQPYKGPSWALGLQRSVIMRGRRCAFKGKTCGPGPDAQTGPDGGAPTCALRSAMPTLLVRVASVEECWVMMRAQVLDLNTEEAASR